MTKRIRIEGTYRTELDVHGTILALSELEEGASTTSAKTGAPNRPDALRTELPPAGKMDAEIENR